MERALDGVAGILDQYQTLGRPIYTGSPVWRWGFYVLYVTFGDFCFNTFYLQKGWKMYSVASGVGGGDS